MSHSKKHGLASSSDHSVASLVSLNALISGGQILDSTGDIMTGSLVISGADLTVSNLLTISGVNQTITTDSTGKLIKSGYSNSVITTQAIHGFSQLNVIYNNSGTWTKAQANNVNTLAIAVVTDVVDVDVFEYATNGIATITNGVSGHGLTVGEYYYTSSSSAGQITPTPPEELDEYSNPVIYVLDNDNIFILPW